MDLDIFITYQNATKAKLKDCLLLPSHPLSPFLAR